MFNPSFWDSISDSTKATVTYTLIIITVLGVFALYAADSHTYDENGEDQIMEEIPKTPVNGNDFQTDREVMILVNPNTNECYLCNSSDVTLMMDENGNQIKWEDLQ